jgi:hypothetical protein
MNFPNLARLANTEPDKLTSRQLQVNAIRQDYEAKHPISPSPEKTQRMADAVPALLAHIDELYGENERLRQYAETTRYHQDKHAATVRELEQFRSNHTEVAATEFEAMARDLYRRADNLPLNDDQQVQRLGDFREIADQLMKRANELRGAR